MNFKKYLIKKFLIFPKSLPIKVDFDPLRLLSIKFFLEKKNTPPKTNINFQLNHQLNIVNTLKWLQTKKVTFQKTKSLLNFYSVYHLQEYFTMIWRYNFCFRATNLITIVKRYYKLIKRKIKWTKMPKKLKFIYPQDVYNLFFCSFVIKDIFLIQTWIKKQFERKSIKIYKTLIYTIWSLMKLFGWHYRQYNHLRGIYLTFKGKLVKGGSRKKLIAFNLGNLKSSSKKNKFLSTSFVLRTISGSVSCRLYLTF